MSGINPLSALLQSTLDLGLPADLLQAQISVGDVLSALVLAPQNGHDLLEILGQQVVAQLPPDVRPGETLLLEVNGFSGSSILVRNLGVQDPENPPQTPPLQTPVRPAQVQAPRPQPASAPAPAAPPREVFVAASVRPAPPPQAGLRAGVQAVVQQAASAVQHAVRSAGDILKAARVPDTALTRTAAAIAPQAPVRLPAVLQRLDAALPRNAADPRVATLRTLIAFTGRLQPASEETLPAQISAYVSHVVQGAEAKVAQLLQAHADVRSATLPAPAPQAPPQPLAASSAPPAAPPTAGEAAFDASASAPVPSQTLARTQTAKVSDSGAVAHARVAERQAAAEHDLKSVVLSLLREPPADKTPALMQALNETLITLTGTQLGALASTAQDSGSIAFALPMYFHEGGKPAYLRISRNAQGPSSKMDADTFHVAFVLDTANLGTVAIDVQSSGRSIQLEVKTERDAAAQRFSDTLHQLRSRLEDLRYRVSGAAAKALRHNAAPPKWNAGTRASDGLDLRA